jgi:pimeloyl-ACP methyl ester carboxylesterase
MISRGKQCAESITILETSMSTHFLSRVAVKLPLAAIALAVSSAYAAPVQGPADDTFFTYPAALPGTKGELISYRQTTVKLGDATTPAVKAWNVIYQTTDSKDAANAVSGTVLVPTAAWTGTGPRPIVTYAVGTHGLATSCAPSKKLALGTDYEIANINAALAKGYTVLVTDYRGALSGPAASAQSTYLAGKAQGNATLDIVKAAAAIPGAGLSLSSPVIVWGYSQGGQSASWAAEQLANGYAPELKVLGVAAGGVPGNFERTAHYLDGGIGFAFFGAAINGLNRQYPNQIPINLLASTEGKAALADIGNLCVFEALFKYENKGIADYVNQDPADPTTLDTLLEVPSVQAVLSAQNLGNVKLTVPLYQFHGQADEFIPLDQAVALKKAYCAKGSNVAFDLFPSEHIVTQFQGATTVIPWIADRLAGKAQASTCNSNAADPKPTNNPVSGDFIITLNDWNVAGNVGLKTLGQIVPLPAGSKLKADANVTKQTLTGALTFPAYKTPIKVIGLNLSIGLLIESAGNLSGSTKVDNDGVVTIAANAPVNITVTNVLGLSWGTCKTVSPVNFPVNFTGPVSALGSGGLQFSGTTSFPQIKGCFISAILSGLMSGNGQTFTLQVSPPAPVKL